MSDSFSPEPMLEMYIFETSQLIEQLEQTIISSERSSCFTENAVNEIFRIMHTIKGSSTMMMFDNISNLSHSIEDLFYFIREKKPDSIDYSKLSDIVLDGIDFIKIEVEKIIAGKKPDGDNSSLISGIKSFISDLKKINSSPDFSADKEHANQQKYYKSQTEQNPNNSFLNTFRAVISFVEGCEMENIRAYSIVHNLKGFAAEIHHIPKDLVENDDSIDLIRKEGFKIFLKSEKSYDEIHKLLMQTVFLNDLELTQLEDDEEYRGLIQEKQIIMDTPINVPQLEKTDADKKDRLSSISHQNIISVSVAKLDKLMDLVGELVISEAMVIQNPDLKELTLDNFQKAARQLQKITDELQDIIMSVRMVPLDTTFQKMNRVARDMSKKLSKEVNLEIIGEETEVDKNIIDHISDPLMHLIRNSIDHGLESAEERRTKGKQEVGTVTLEAKNAGGDVLIIVKDDGKGLSREKILARAKENGLINRSEKELSDKEVFSYIFLPGFSTNDQVTEFSGRGVGMDVVTKNIGAIGGMVSVDSIPDKGTTITLKIPLTLAIMDGMLVRVGKAIYTIPIISIRESFRPNEGDIIIDPDGNEMIIIRGECYSVLRLHELYNVNTQVTNIHDGILVMVENEANGLCIFADELLGKQQVVVKALPNYIKRLKKVKGLAGCTLLGDGSISLILDVAGLLEN